MSEIREDMTLLNNSFLASGGMEFKKFDSTALIQQLSPLNLLFGTFIGQQYKISIIIISVVRHSSIFLLSLYHEYL